MLPLLSLAQQRFLTAYHPVSGTPTDSMFSGFALQTRLLNEFSSVYRLLRIA